MIRAGKLFGLLLPGLVVAALVALPPNAAQATYYNQTGSNELYDGGGTGIPVLSDPLTWDSSSYPRVGYGLSETNYTGTMTFDDSEGAKTITTNDLTVGAYFNTAGAGTLTFGGTGMVWNLAYNVLGVGSRSTGELNILNGATINGAPNNVCDIGSGAGGAGTITVDASTLNVTKMTLGNYGSTSTGVLNISNGGTVTTAGATYVGPTATVAGNAINFSTGTLTTASLYAAPTSITGTGVINARGIISDVNLTIDSEASKAQSFTLNGGVTVNLDVTNSGTASNGDLGAGYAGNGSLTISNGISVQASGGAIGYKAGSHGTVTVDGASNFACNLNAGNNLLSSPYYVGYFGNGTLNVRNGSAFQSTASTSPVFVGYNAGSTGAVSFDAGAAMVISSYMCLGLGGSATLSFTNTSAGSSTGAVYIASGGPITTPTGGGGTVTLNHSNWMVTGGRFYVGTKGNGLVKVENGSILTTGSILKMENTYIGADPMDTGAGGTGVVTVDGYGSQWKNASSSTVNVFVIGGSGYGAVRITNGGYVSNNKPPIYVGFNYAGLNAGGGGAISVDGKSSDGVSPSTFTTNTVLYLGRQTDATLTVTNGAYAATTNGSASLFVGGYIIPYGGSPELGWNPTGTVLVDGANSRLSLGGDLNAAYNGSAIVNISNGGAVASVNTYIGGNSTVGTGLVVGSTGVITVSGAGSTWTNTGTIHAGYRKTATINLDGGTILVDSIVGGGGGGTMSINFNGGTLKPNAAAAATWISRVAGTSNLYVEEGGAKFDTNGSSPTIALPLQHSGSSATDGGLTKLGLGTLTLSGSNTYTGWTTVSGGALSLGQIGLYDASNVRVDTGTTLDLTFSGPDTVHYLFFGGLAQTAGTYDVSNSGGFITGGGSLYVSATALQGDADLNGTVNSTDLGLLLSHYNQVGTGFAWGLGDFDANGTINSTDLGLLLSHYNQVSAATSAVPEPSTLFLLAASLIGLLAYAWRKK